MSVKVWPVQRASHYSSHRTFRRRNALLLGGFFVLWACLLLTGCGQVITLTPTVEPSPTATIGLTLAADALPATATPAPYTPEPTLTPTLTPTPIVHTVQGGESLLTVAGQYDVSVAALQDANGILDPRTLQVGQQLIIPRPEEAEGGVASTATPTPLPLQIQNVYLGDTTIGNLWILGEVQNDSGTPVEQVSVRVNLVDAAAKVVAEQEELVALDLITVGERAPFALLFAAPHPAFTSYQVVIAHAVPAYVGSYYRDLVVEGIETTQERYATYTVNGMIRNTGPEEAVSVQVVLTAYDSLDRVIATRKIEPAYNVVPTGGTTTFTAILAPLGGPIARIEAVAQGRRLPK